MGTVHSMYRRRPGLGDAGVSNDDTSYTGADDSSVFTMDYYRSKAQQFQVTMQALDQAAQAASDMMEVTDDNDLVLDLANYLTDYDEHKYQFRLAAETINAGAATVNALGGRFPQLSVPPGLAMAPVIMGAAALAALATAAALIVWGNTWLKGISQRMNVAAAAQMIDDPDKRAVFLQAAVTAQAAADAADDSPLSSIANMVKWVAIAAGVYFAFNAIGGR